VPVSNLFFPIGVTLALRVLYFPLVAPALAFGWMWERWRSSIGEAAIGRPKRYALVPDLAMAAALALLVLASRDFAPAWRTQLDFAERTVDRFPRSWRGHQNLAGLAYLRKEYERGLEHARIATELRPDEATSWDSRGLNAMFIASHGDEAETALRRAIALGPELVLPHHHLAMLLLKRHRPREALAVLEECLELAPAARAITQAQIDRIRLQLDREGN
jgi:tetratricopeptide (TPR) repeat protein